MNDPNEPRGKPPQGGACEIYLVDEQRVGRALESMLPAEVVQDVAEMFKVLAHPTRVKIVRALAEEELCVCDLARILELSVSATSHQLRLLRQKKLVAFRADGKLVYYSLRDRFISALLENGARHLTNAAGAA